MKSMALGIHYMFGSMAFKILPWASMRITVPKRLQTNYHLFSETPYWIVCKSVIFWK